MGKCLLQVFIIIKENICVKHFRFNKGSIISNASKKKKKNYLWFWCKVENVITELSTYNVL